MSSSEESAVEALDTVENEIETVENNENVEIQADEDNEAETDQNKTIVKPKRVVRNPQPKLNEQTLKEAKGLTAIQGYFERVKFKGRGYEEQDLNVLMKTYEYWCHRMFPKYPFDTSIARLETLGTKRATQTLLKRIRMDLIFDEDKPVEDEDETVDIPLGDNVVNPVETSDSQFDQLISSTSNSTAQANVITDEQLERIRQNKERAEKLRQEKMKKIREKAAVNLEQSNHLERTTGSASQHSNSNENTQNQLVHDNAANRLGQEPPLRGVLNEEEEEIDTILDNINEKLLDKDESRNKCDGEETVSNNLFKKKRQLVIDDDDEEEIDPEESSNKLSKNDQHGNNSDVEENISNNVFRKKRQLVTDDEEEMDTILDQINEDDETSNRLSENYEDRSNSGEENASTNISRKTRPIIDDDEQIDEIFIDQVANNSDDENVSLSRHKRKTRLIMDDEDEENN